MGAKAFGKIFLFLAVISVFLMIDVYGQNLTINITEPQNTDRVCWRDWVRGTISDPNLQVFVLIHPVATNRFWVQPIPDRGSQWRSYCYFGEPDRGIEEQFEIIAVASGNKTLFKEGDTLPSPLPDNPQILVRSRPVLVTRDTCLQR